MRVVLVLLMLPAMVACQEFQVVGSAITVEWDYVPDAHGGVISYEVVRALVSGGESVMNTVSTTRAPISFTVPGAYRIGVRVRRTLNGVSVFSDYTWSDVGGYPSPWIALYLPNPPSVQRVRIQTPQ